MNLLKKIIFSTFSILIPSVLTAETILTVIGDSNSSNNKFIYPEHECWPTFLQKELSDYDVKVINWSIPGANFAQGCWMLNNMFRNGHTDIIIMTLGMNDILQKVPLDRCSFYLTTFLNLCKQNNSLVIIGKTDASYFEKQDAEYMKKFTKLYDRFADSYKTLLFDFITLQDLQNAPDHIHPNREWHKKMAKKLAQLIIEKKTEFKSKIGKQCNLNSRKIFSQNS